MKINGKLHITFDELARLLGLPDDITVEMVSCSPDDIAGGAFTVHVHKPGQREMLPFEHAPILQSEQDAINNTREARHQAVWSDVRFGGGGDWRPMTTDYGVIT